MASKLIKCKGPVCKDELDLDMNEYEQGDFVKCEECSELLEVEIKAGKFRLVTDTEKKNEEMEDLDAELDEEEDE